MKSWPFVGTCVLAMMGAACSTLPPGQTSDKVFAKRMGSEPSAQTQPSDELLVKRMGRIVRDLARFDVGLIAKIPQNSWIVAQFTPYESGLEKASWAFDEDGESLDLPDSPYQLEYRGIVEVKKELTVPPYSPVHAFAEERSLVPLGIEESSLFESPFLDPAGSIVICRVNAGSLGFNRYRPAISIPPTWAHWVVPALDAYKKNASIFLHPADAGNAERLAALLDTDNPFIALAAGRALQKAGLVDARRFVKSLAGTDTFRQGAMTVVVLKSQPSPATDALADLVTAVDAAKSFGQVRGIALGALVFVVDLNPQRNMGAIKWSAGHTLTDALARKLAVESNATPADRYLISLLRTMGENQ